MLVAINYCAFGVYRQEFTEYRYYLSDSLSSRLQNRKVWLTRTLLAVVDSVITVYILISRPHPLQYYSLGTIFVAIMQ